MLIFLTYLIFSLLLIFGINTVSSVFESGTLEFKIWPNFSPQYKKRFFIPYVVLDAVFIALAFVGCLAGFIASILHLFRVSFIFLVIKVYIECCVVSLFREYRNKVNTEDSAENPSSPVIEEQEKPAPV